MSYSGRSVEHQSRHFARLVRSNWWTHPIFNTLDANNPSMNVSTPAARLAAYSMLLSRGVSVVAEHRRANSEWELIAVEDPHGFANLERLVHWRRVMPTINFKRSEERRVGKECRSRWWASHSSRRRHTRCSRDWSSDVCSSDLLHTCCTTRRVQHALESWCVRRGGAPPRKF